MHLHLHFFVFLFLLYQAFAAPTPRTQRKGRSFKVDRVRRGDYVPHGPAALGKAYRKFNIEQIIFDDALADFEPIKLNHTKPSTNQKITDPDRSGTVSAASVQSDAEFVSPVVIGGQKIIMDFDTGSSNFWVLSTKIPAAARQGHTVFDPSRSSTFKVMDNAQFQISYGDSSYAAGIVGTDTVNIGGVTVENQAIGIPIELSPSLLEDHASNGLVGLGFKSLSTIEPKKQPTFFGNVVPTLDEPVLTAALRSDGIGEYEFGMIDHQKYSGQMANITVDNSNGYWEFPSTRFSVGRKDMQEIKKAPTAIADTGTSLMLVSPEVVEAYYAQVDGATFANQAGGYVYPCKAELPDLSIAVGHTMAVIPGSMINFSTFGSHKSNGAEYCFGGIQSNQGVPMQIFGDVFLKALFVVFDHRGPSIGLASPA